MLLLLGIGVSDRWLCLLNRRDTADTFLVFGRSVCIQVAFCLLVHAIFAGRLIEMMFRRFFVHQGLLAILRCLTGPPIGRGLLVGWLKLGWIVRLCLLGYGLEVFIVVLGEEGYVAHLESARLFLWLARSLYLGGVLCHLVGRGCRVSVSAHGTEYLVVVFSANFVVL